MNLPAHPPHTDDEPANTRSRRRAITAAIVLVILLVSIHLLRTALG